MSRVLIIGYGNPLRGDDAFGWQAAERLRAQIANPEIEILTLHQLTPELMEQVSQAEKVIFLDAAASGEPGRILRRHVTGKAEGAAFTHSATADGLIRGARALYGSAPPAILYTVAGTDFSFGSALSAPVSASLSLVIDEIVNNLRITSEG